MQKDYMGMAQGQQAPAAPAQQAPMGEQAPAATPPTEQEVEEMIPTDEEYSADGFTAGDSPEAVKQRILEFLEKIGLMEDFKDQSSKVEFLKQLDAYVKALFEQNEDAIVSNPVHDILQQASAGLGDLDSLEQLENKQPTGGPVPQQGAAAPTDFASMMPPTPGGGMGGR